MKVSDRGGVAVPLRWRVGWGRAPMCRMSRTRYSVYGARIGIAGCDVLFRTFYTLLVSMVGPELTERLLRTVLAPSSSGAAAQDITQ